MSAYLVGHIHVKDSRKWDQYVAGVAESLRPFDSEIVFRGSKAEVLAGNHPFELAVVIRFADQDKLREWFHSEAYQKLIPLREKASEVVIVSYDAG